MKYRNYAGPVSGKNSIKYYVNEEKKTCTAVLENIPWDMSETARSFVNKTPGAFGFFNVVLMDKFIKNIPDKITATAKCSELDEFNSETGCALARARVLEKLYKYRGEVMDQISDYYYDISCKAMSNSIHYQGRAEDYNEEIDAIINETFNN